MPRSNLCKPRVHPNIDAIYRSIDIARKINNERQADLGKLLKIRQNTVSHHFKHHSFTAEQINELLDHYGLEIKICAKSV